MGALQARVTSFRSARSFPGTLGLVACLALFASACGDGGTASTSPTELAATSSATAAKDVALLSEHSLIVRVKNPAPVVGILVTATDAETGNVFYDLTDDAGLAHLSLATGRYIVTTRRVASSNPRQLQVWPYTGGEVPAVGAELGSFSGAVYVGGRSVTLTPTNFNSAFRSPLVLNAKNLGLLQGEIQLNLTPAATIQCRLLDVSGDPFRGSDTQLFASLPHFDTIHLPPVPASYTGNRALPRGLGYGVAEVESGGPCLLPGAPPGVTVIETPPVATEHGPVIFRTAVDVSQAEAASGATVDAILTPQPALAFTNYFTGEPWGDSRGAADIGGLITFGWMGRTGNSFGVTSEFRGSGIYVLELFTSNPGTNPSSSRAAVRVAILCSPSGCVLLRSRPVPPAGATGTGVRVVVNRVTQGALIWQVPIPGNQSSVWLRVVSPSGSSIKDQTVVLKAVRTPGSGNSYLIMAGS